MSGQLWINGEPRATESARFDINLLTEGWDEKGAWVYGPNPAWARYSLEVSVDEHSGEDGAPAPTADSIPVWAANGNRHPSLAELGALEVPEGDEDWDAWYGNDAPPLRANRLRFLGWQDGRLRLRWEAAYDEYDPERREEREGRLVYEGDAEFGGIRLQVKAPEDADRFLAEVWGGQPLETLRREELGWTDYGEDFPADRRRWYTVRYWPVTP